MILPVHRIERYGFIFMDGRVLNAGDAGSDLTEVIACDIQCNNLLFIRTNKNHIFTGITEAAGVFM